MPTERQTGRQTDSCATQHPHTSRCIAVFNQSKNRFGRQQQPVQEPYQIDIIWRPYEANDMRSWQEMTALHQLCTLPITRSKPNTSLTAFTAADPLLSNCRQAAHLGVGRWVWARQGRLGEGASLLAFQVRHGDHSLELGHLLAGL